MLTASSGFKSAIENLNRKYDIKVTIVRNDSTQKIIDISDRVISYNCSHDFESRSGTLSLEIDNYDYQLSPLNRDSSFNLSAGVYDPLLDSNHVVELYEGVMVGGNFEYIKKFEGYMGDEISASSSPTITITCRDKSKLLQDTYIYEGPSYSLMIVEDVIQDMILEFAPETGIVLDVIDPTYYMIGRPDGPYSAKDTNLWDAIQLLADSASQELRFMEDGNLIIRNIDRDFLDKTASIQLNSSNLISDNMDISDSDVRNHIVIKVQNYDPITKKDDYSISKYGRRYMEVHRSMSDVITDISQAHELGDNILRDLRFATPNDNAEIALHPLIQVGDIVEIINPRLGTNIENDIFKVVNVQNRYSADRKRTYLQLKGHDKFLSSESIQTEPPTNLTFDYLSRTIQNYSRSGWSGYEKLTRYIKLKWIPPTKDIDGNTLDSGFGGYIVYRRVGQVVNGSTQWGNWSTISSIPSFIKSLNLNIDYFYDYSSSSFDKGRPVEYKIVAVNSVGIKSLESNTVGTEVPRDRFYDMYGTEIS